MYKPVCFQLPELPAEHFGGCLRHILLKLIESQKFVGQKVIENDGFIFSADLAERRLYRTGKFSFGYFIHFLFFLWFLKDTMYKKRHYFFKKNILSNAQHVLFIIQRIEKQVFFRKAEAGFSGILHRDCFIEEK